MIRAKGIRKRGWIFAVVLIVLIVVLAANAGRVLVVDAPERSDVIARYP
jgi:hypothetical protein